MLSRLGRATLVVALGFFLAFSPYARAAAASTIQLNDPITDTALFWGGVASALGSLVHEIAAAFTPHHGLAANPLPKPHAPKNYAPSAMAAPAALAVAPVSETPLLPANTSGALVTPQQSQSRSPPTAASDPTTFDPPLAPAPNASAFVTHGQFNIGLAALGNSLRQLIAESANSPVVSGPGAPLSVEAFAPSQAINQLNNVTITNATVSGVSGLSASDIPALGYLSLSGGVLTGSLTVPTITASSSLFDKFTAANATTTNLAVTGTSTFAAIKLSTTNCATFGNSGKLTTDAFGNVICAGDQGGSGSAVAGSNTQVQFNAFGTFGGSSNFTFATSTNTLTVSNASTTNLSVSGNTSLAAGTSTTFFSTLANFTTAVANTLSASVANIVGITAINSTTTNATTTSLYAASAVVPSLSATNATTTSLGINGQTFTNLLGAGLNNTAGALTVSLSPFSTSNLAEGTNLYFTNARVASVIAATTTDALAEGSNNKYFTNARAQSAISVSGVPLTYSSGVIGINQANGSQPGFLTSADWATFNNKVASTSLSGGAPITYNSGTGAIGFDFAHANTWTGTQTFSNIFATNATSTSLYITGITGKLLKTDANGQVAAAIAGTDYQAPITAGNLTTGSNLSVSGGAGAVIGSGASISLGSNVVTSVANDTNVTGSIASNALTLGWTGLLGVLRGGTGSSTLSGILKGNGTSAVQSAVGGTDYEFPLTFSTGLNRTGNTVTNTGVLNIGSGFATTTGTAITLSTSTQSFNGLTIAQTISSPNSSNILFTPAISGTLNNSGLTNSTISGIALGGTLASLNAGSGLSGSAYNGSGTQTFSLNLSNANNWTSLQTFQNASSTNLSVFANAYFGGTATSSFNNAGVLTLASPGANSLLYTNASSQVAAVTVSSPLSFSSGTLSIPAANGSTNGYLASGDWTAFNNKLASSSLATSALLAGLISDHTGSGSLVFGTSPTFAGTPTFGGGGVNYSVNSTSTIPNNTPYAWTVATSTTAAPLIQVDTTGSGSVSIGAASSSGSSVVLGGVGQPANLIFQENSTIEGAGSGRTITIGANSDIINFGVNVGIGTTSPSRLLTLDSASATGTILRLSNSSTGGHIFDLLSTGSGNTDGAGRLDLFDSTAAAARFSIASNGNIGIGTTTPGSIFSVQGVANWTGATSTYYSTGGINLTSGCFAVNGTCITGGGGGAVNSVSNSDGTLTISPTSGSVVASLNLANANTWTGGQIFGNATSTNLAITGTASTSALVISGIANGSVQCLQINGVGQVTGTGSGCGGSGSTPGGSNTQIQFNNNGAFGGAANLFWDSANNRLGIGTSSPYALLSVATPNGASGSVGTLFAISSSTPTATTTLFSIDNRGSVVSTLAASSSFMVGANGATNPAFQIFASTTNAATGLQLVSNLAGNGVSLNTISSGANEALSLSSKGTGNLKLIAGGSISLINSGNNSEVMTGSAAVFNLSTVPTNGSGPNFVVNGGAGGSATAGIETPNVYFNLSQTNNHANGALSIFRSLLVNAPTETFTSFNGGANNFTDLATFAVTGAPITAATGNGTTTNAHTIYLGASALNASTTNSYGLTVNANTGAVNNYAAEFLGGNVGINTKAPGNYLAISTSTNLGTISLEYNGASQNAGGFNNSDNGAGSQTVFNFLRNNTQVGTISETNTATAYNTTSDRRVKENIATTTLGLSTLVQLPVRDFDFIKDPTHATTTGFIAQELFPIFPEAVTTNGDNGVVPLGATSTPWSVDYGRITPLIVKAVQDIANITSTFQRNLIAWLGNATNGITDLFAANGHFSDELCVGSTCVTPAQFQAMVAATNQSSAGGSSSPPPGPISDATDTPPVIQINGHNPAIVQVGDTYNDLGATITGPEADINLGIKTFVNGALVSEIVIDTSAVATDTIDYVVTDNQGLISTSTRMVIVQAPPASLPVSSSIASTTEDTAATTTATQ